MSENNHRHGHGHGHCYHHNHCIPAAAAAAETMSEDDEPGPPPPPPPPDPGSKKTKNCAAVHPSPHPDRVLEIVLEHVLQFLTARRDRNAASLVCKSWSRAEALTRSDVFIGNCYSISPARVTTRFPRVRAVAIKGRPRFADFNLMQPNWGGHFGPWLAAMAQAYPWLERVYLKRVSLTDRDLCLLAESFAGFKELVLVCCEGFGTGGLATIASKCSQLRVLDLSDTEVADDGVDWISCFPEGKTCLEALIFDCVECPINFEALEDLVARSPALRKLRLNREVSIGQLYRLMVRAPQLTHLGTGAFGPSEDQEHNDQEPDYAAAFSACGSLVCLSGFKAVLPEYLPAIYPVCANLTSLNLSYANLSVEQFKSIICHCHKLQVLWVLDSVCDEGLKAIAAACPDLRELRVFPLDPQEGAEGPVSEIGLQAISEGCPKLESILYFCQRMTNAAVIAMSKNCPELVVFRLCIMGRHQPDYATGAPMDEGFGAIVMNCKKLTRLSMSGLLTDRTFGYIGKYGKLVRTLSVAFAGDSDTALKYLLEGCPNLQKLEIRDSPFGDGALLSGLHHYYNMRFLWMSSCQLSRQGCQQVARALPGLVVELLNYDGNEKMDDDAVDILYMYRSLDGPRNDAPRFVSIL